MKKKITLITMLIALAFIFAGCSFAGSISTNFSYKSEKKESTGTYTLKFNDKEDSETHALSMGSEGTVLIKLNSMVSDGTVSIKILTDQDKIVYENSGETLSINESFMLNAGVYKILLDYASDKRGSLKLELHSESDFEYYRCEDYESANER